MNSANDSNLAMLISQLWRQGRKSGSHRSEQDTAQAAAEGTTHSLATSFQKFWQEGITRKARRLPRASSTEQGK